MYNNTQYKVKMQKKPFIFHKYHKNTFINFLQFITYKLCNNIAINKLFELICNLSCSMCMYLRYYLCMYKYIYIYMIYYLHIYNLKENIIIFIATWSIVK